MGDLDGTNEQHAKESPKMISLLLPTRKRPAEFKRMVESAYKTSTAHQIEIIARVDEDDIDPVIEEFADKVIVGPRIRKMTQYWNECFDVCSGDIVMQANDDIVFITPGWDVLVEKAFAEVEDKILLVHGCDVFGHGGRFGPHPLVSRRWVQALGYFIPPHYVSDFGDAHLGELADRLGRRRFVPFDIEHHHYSYGMCEMDENTRERLQRHSEDNPDATYYSQAMSAQRTADVAKLAALMFSTPDTTGWTPPGTQSGMGKCPKCGSLATVILTVGRLACNACGIEWTR
jgi:glycosyltransferase involved in cell wall biosynthesis